MSVMSKFTSLFVSLILVSSPLLLPLNAVAASRSITNRKPDTITGTMEGRVVDAAGQPISDVRIRVTNEETGNQRSTKTNAEGYYKIALLPLGFYRIEALKDGFTYIRRTREPAKIQLNKLFQTNPDIVLAPEAVAAAERPRWLAPWP